MTPEQVSAISAIAQILEKIGTMPIFSLITCVVAGPWVMAFIISRQQEKRFEAVKIMYEKNVELVKCYEDIAKNQQDLIIMTTQASTRVEEKIDKNLFCPMVRKETRPTPKEATG